MRAPLPAPARAQRSRDVRTPVVYHAMGCRCWACTAPPMRRARRGLAAILHAALLLAIGGLLVCGTIATIRAIDRAPAGAAR
ncbi:hypothetical protein ACFQ1E_17475 [Sphingomonas canadensis]|uniref:Lipoprotein n=1 Tax=Sphingomonas canadensis TaxID=1219257 RepID=A0ABW3HBH7_9SPHN|nr:hypothetical protein [Sphingomonas canadensis]MCW3837838.1 hypothetical protein [Sphingomonas canadensis]